MLSVRGEHETLFLPRAFNNPIPLYMDFIIKITIILLLILYLLPYISPAKMHIFEKLHVRSTSIIKKMCIPLYSTGIIQTLIYASRGFIHLQFMIIYVSALAFCIGCMLVRNNRARKMVAIKYFLAGLLIVLVVTCAATIKFFSLLLDSSSSYYGQEYYDYMLLTTLWLAKYLDKGLVLSDHYTSSLLLFNLVKEGKTNAVYSFRAFHMIHVFYEESCSKMFCNTLRYFNILIVSALYRYRVIVGDAWGPFGSPLKEQEIKLLNTCIFLRRIYDGFLGTIYSIQPRF